VWRAEFPERAAFARERKPVVLATLRAQGAETSDVALHLDTGAEFSLFDRAVLEPFGFAPPAIPDPQDQRWKSFVNPAGEIVAWAFRFDDLLISIDGTSLAFNLDVYGSTKVGTIHRNILGRDFLRKVVAGFAFEDGVVYLRDRSTGAGVVEA
jgi:hypothetical protein